MNHLTHPLRKFGRAGAVLVALGVGGFWIATAAGSQAVSVQTHIVSSTDTDFALAACSAAPCPSHHTVTVTCPTLYPVLLSGGVTNVNENGPNFGNGGDVEVHETWPSSTQTWAVDLISINGATHVDATAYAICRR